MPRFIILLPLIGFCLVALYFLPSNSVPLESAASTPDIARSPSRVFSKRHIPPLLPHHTYSSHQKLALVNHPPAHDKAPFEPPHWYAELSSSSIDATLASLVALDPSVEPVPNVNGTRHVQVLPFFYRATSAPAKQAITITTLVTPSRFPVLARLAAHYDGPISVAIPLLAPMSLTSLHDFYISHPALSRNVDIHLVLNSPARAFNTWRNVARAFSRTDNVMMLDADFFPCTPFAQHIMANPAAQDLLSSGAMLVMPAFEYTDHATGLNASAFPRTKQDLLPLLKSKQVGQFHSPFSRGHGATDYGRFAAAQPEEIYRVKGYTHSYEPYVVFNRDKAPWCDERFVGYGANKAACLFELYLSGRSFYVLADDFVIHQSHAYLEDTRKAERKVNKKLYQSFREDLCTHYLLHYRDTSAIDMPISRNARRECKKVLRIGKKTSSAVVLKKLRAS